MLLFTDFILTGHTYKRINILTDRSDDDYDDDDLHNLAKIATKRKESDYLKNYEKTNKEIESNGQLSIDRSKTRTQSESSSVRNDNKHGKGNVKNEPSKQRELDDAVEYGLRAMQELLEVKEPKWYRMGLYLEENEPASHVAAFGSPTKKAIELSKIGYASIEASKKIAESYPENVSRQSAGFLFDTHLLQEECPLRGLPRCLSAARRYRTADGTCNNFNKPWRGSSFLPMQRFLPPVYEDGIQEVRRSEFDKKLPSAREISIKIHRDKNLELPTVNLMFMQWGQFLDHDLVSTAKSRSFNGSIPRCCHRGGQDLLPPDLTHPSCLPIEVSRDDWFLAPLGIRCIEFIRSAPSTRIDCDLGWREQINQATSYLDGSTIYGSDVETSDTMRTFRRGQLHYGRVQGREPLQPPDPPEGEICRSGALTSDCLQGGDGRLSEQPGLTALHIVWLRYHNRIAEILSQINRHWSDEKVYQETRRIVIALVQHITYREFLPIVLGQEVMELFELNLERKGFYKGYDRRVNPSIANSFGTAAFRFGHSLVQSSFIRFDTKHRPLFNNVSLHEEQANVENIWSFGSLDRLLLGFCNQPSQRRDEFISEELTNHLFQSPGFPFGMDLAAINIQRGRDHGLPAYSFWREPCGLTPIKTWADLLKIMNPDTVNRLKSIYDHINDIDLFTGGLAEKPVRGGIIGPTFACIIAQQFLNLRKGDRFWYENGGFESSFTPAQLQQIRHVTFAHVLCHTLTEIETVQPFVFLAPDQFRNSRLSCDSPVMNNFDLSAWVERDDGRAKREIRRQKKRKLRRTTTTKRPKTTSTVPVTVKVKNITTHTVQIETKQTYNTNRYTVNTIPKRPTYDSYTTPRNDVTYLIGLVSDKTTTKKPTFKPFEVNIKIQYYPPTTTERPTSAKKKRKPNLTTRRPLNYNYYITKPSYYDTTTKGNIYSDDFAIYKPAYVVKPPRDYYFDQSATSTRPYVYRPNNYVYSTKNPTPSQNYYSKRPYIDVDRDDSYDRLYGDLYSTNTRFGQYEDNLPRPIKHYGQVDKLTTLDDYDKFDFYPPRRSSNDHNRDTTKTKFVKISSVKGEEFLDPSGSTVELHVAQREGDLDLALDDDSSKKENEDVRLVDIDVVPGESKWLLYNATEEVMELMEIPDVNSDVSCSHELPRPINVTMTNVKTVLKT